MSQENSPPTVLADADRRRIIAVLRALADRISRSRLYVDSRAELDSISELVAAADDSIALLDAHDEEKTARVPPCDICGKTQTSLGALEFGPPMRLPNESGWWCRKIHVCQACHQLRHGA